MAFKPMTRRDFLATGVLGVGALGPARGLVSTEPATARGPERSVILLLLVGGPSQLETFDPKPEAPADIRGPFSSIATRVPGIRVCEHLPLMAARMDRLALVRSVYHESAPIHETGFQLVQTGRICRAGSTHPHFGSVVARLAGEAHDGSSPFAIVPGPIAGTGIDIPHGQSSGWLGARYEPLYHSACDGLDYGPSQFGRSCLTARRLIEAGVRVVTVNMYDTVFDRVSWDCHGTAPFATLADYAREVLPTFDQVFSRLIDDLERRGRLESTLVIAAGEFGRTPRVNVAGGRDHWPGVWSVVFAGGGVRGGQVIGASDAHASEPRDRPVTPADLVATIFASLGINPAETLGRSDGPSDELVEKGEPISELFQ
jgi:hypothetical protein